MRSMDVSRYLDSLTLYSPLPISHATGSCTCTFPFLFHVFPYLYQCGLTTRLQLPTCSFSVSRFGLLTRTLTFLAYAFLLPLCRLVSMLTICAYAYLMQFVDSSVASLFLDSDLLLSHFPFLYFCTCISRPLYIRVGDVGLFPIFNLLCNHPKGVTCEIPHTLLVLSSSLAKATASRLLGSSPLFIAYR